jgi:putative methyltransferase (TIGR04325 family)
MKEQDFNNWEGVYENWDQAPVDDGVFAGGIWLNKISSAAQKNLESYQTPASISPVSATRDYILPVVASMIERRAGEVIRILDFGGGLAASYFPLATSHSEPDNLEFHTYRGGRRLCPWKRNIFRPTKHSFS